MPNPAPTDHPVHALTKRRWSPRAFTKAPVTVEQMRSLFEAARWAPSSRNEQPWSFLVALREDEGGFARFFGCLMPGNQSWAGAASALLLSVAEARRADGSENRYAVHDTALAVANLVLQATSMDLYTHQIGGFDASKARVEFGVPQEIWSRVVYGVQAASLVGATSSVVLTPSLKVTPPTTSVSSSELFSRLHPRCADSASL